MAKRWIADYYPNQECVLGLVALLAITPLVAIGAGLPHKYAGLKPICVSRPKNRRVLTESWPTGKMPRFRIH